MVFKEVNDSNIRISDKNLLLNPNLGHPILLNMDNKIRKNEFETDLLFVSDIKDPKIFEKSIRHRIKLIPILEYKWKLRYILEKEGKKRLARTLEKKKITLWKRIKRKLIRKKTSDIDAQISLQDQKVSDFAEDKLKGLKPRAFRGDPIIPVIMHTGRVFFKGIDNLNYDSYYSPQEYLIKRNIISNLDKFYRVSINFMLTDEVKEYLKKKKFLMFDIIHEEENGDRRINYHSLVLSKNTWKNFKFVHATDLHIAERNDRIYGIIKKWTKGFLTQTIKGTDQAQKTRVSFFKRLFKTVPTKLFEISKPLKKRLINPNNNFRKFIKLMNRKVLQNDLDFIVLTGDLIDFTILSKIPKDVRKTLDFDYSESNWRVFKEIILNFPQKKRRGVLTGEELLCPIFTIPGNHDYRPFHYDLRWGGLYKKIGLNAEEAIALNDKLLANPISSITKSFRALKAYFLEINPSLDYSFKLGNNNFIFLNAGSDSFKNLRDFLMGKPSVTGLSIKQVKFLENLINYKIEKVENTFLFLHGPPINPRKTISLFKKSSSDILKSIDQLKESIVRKLGKTLSKARIDLKFDVKFGTISSNWEKLIKFCKDHTILTLSGHTHELKEFRLGDPEQMKSTVYQAPPFSLKKLENPAAIYYDLYSEMYTNHKDIEKNLPFVVQTPALGMGGFSNPNLVGGFREIIIKKKKLTSFKVKFVNR